MDTKQEREMQDVLSQSGLPADLIAKMARDAEQKSRVCAVCGAAMGRNCRDTGGRTHPTR